MASLPQIDNAETLKKELAEILAHGPLYRNFVYTGRECHLARQGMGAQQYRYGELPLELELFCSQCKKETRWKVDQKDHFFRSTFIDKCCFTCRNCGEKEQYYQFIWQEKQDCNIFIKVGQYPPLSIEPEPKLAQTLGPDDAELYKKGLVNFNSGYGIGAVAYFRRVLENKINALLDLIIEAARNENMDSAALKTIEAVKQSHRVEDKIDEASKILPNHLKPGGHNPLDKLYGPLSAGLHGESDDDCLTVFKEARFTFEYLFKNLTVSNEEARRYVKELSTPTKALKAADKASGYDG